MDNYFDNDPVMMDIRENFNDRDFSEKEHNKDKHKLGREILIAILIIMITLYIFARFR